MVPTGARFAGRKVGQWNDAGAGRGKLFYSPAVGVLPRHIMSKPVNSGIMNPVTAAVRVARRG